jgi:hypothetical protein
MIILVKNGIINAHLVLQICTLLLKKLSERQQNIIIKKFVVVVGSG